MPWCTGRSVAPCLLNGPQAPGSSSTTSRRSRTPSRQRKADGLFDVHANARYANQMLGPNPKVARFLRDCALRVHCIVCSLVASCLRTSRDFRSIFDIIILFALPRSPFVYRRRGTVWSLTPVRCAVRSSDFPLLWGPMVPQTHRWHGGSRPFLPLRGHSLERRSGCLCRPSCPGCPANFRDCSSGSTRCQDGCHRVPGRRPRHHILSMLRVEPPFAWKLELLGRKRARVEFVAAMWEVDVEMQAREQTPPPPSSPFH